MRYLLLGLLLAASQACATIIVPCSAAFAWGAGTDIDGGQSSWTTRCWTTGRDGGGVFDEAIGPNRAGKVVTGWLANMGLITATPGDEQGDYEMYIPHHGVMFDAAGYGYGVVIDGLDEAFFAPQDGQIDLGMLTHRWRSLNVLTVPCSYSTLGCIRVDGGYVPILPIAGAPVVTPPPVNKPPPAETPPVSTPPLGTCLYSCIPCPDNAGLCYPPSND